MGFDIFGPTRHVRGSNIDDGDEPRYDVLAMVHFGLGIFLANTPRNWESQYSNWLDTDLLKPEYMTPPMFGWALAHLAWFRGEERPEWARHLNGDARANLKQDLRYLFATKDSWYRPGRLR